MAPTKKAEPVTTRTVRLDAEIHRRAKVYAAQHDMDVQRVFAAAVDEYLKKRSA